jgi:pre-mRNA-splicing factor SYF1
MEEKFGLLNHSIEIIDRLSDQIKQDQKPYAYNLYLGKVAEFLGIIRTKPVYEKALENLTGDVRNMRLA